MEFTGERYVPSLKGQIYYEHLHRYAIAARACGGKRVLDVASGEGYGAAFLARFASDVAGVDIDAECIAHARRSYYVPNLRFVHAPATELPLQDGSIDVVTCFETIEHLADHERMLDEFRRVLAPHALLFISSPNKLVYSDRSRHENPFHVRELYYHEFRDMLKRRFANVAIYGQRLIASSVLHPLGGASSDAAGWLTGDLTAIDDGLPTLEDPVYFLAVCSDGPLPDRVASGFVDPSDTMFDHLLQELEMLRGRVYAADDALPPLDVPVALAAAPPPAPDAAHESPAGEPQSGGASDEDVLGAERAARAALEEEAAVLRERANEAERMAALAAAQREEAEAHAARLAAAAESLSASQFATARKLAAQNERVQVLEERIAALAPLLETVRERDETIRERDETIRERDETIRALRGTIAERDAAAEAREARFGELKRVVADREREIGVRDAALVERNAMLAQRDALVAERDRRVAEIERARAEDAARIAAALARLAERDAELAQRDAELAQRDAELAVRDAELTACRGRLAEAENAAAEVRDHAARDSGALREILSSRSWKMTEPFRRAASLVRRREP